MGKGLLPCLKYFECLLQVKFASSNNEIALSLGGPLLGSVRHVLFASPVTQQLLLKLFLTPMLSVSGHECMLSEED